ncbi:EcsC family protein [Xylanibacillus composti]|uniref:ABC transporter-associated protein EcsC n=1 Tax=Xylanibacillus composti TaxID=1572762 RepID=A0A8J4H1N1_9BACL|nr:EcsC family protein [Xylanibacillus composti]MDT9724306.1 EcsC family protein [Xylanibacillus composti]GIQ69302.1 ABC transporter-associated protein EcsC [Xylanibacillus composti]
MDNSQGSESYEALVRRELQRWEWQLYKPPGMLERASKSVQASINRRIPDRVHISLTAAVKGIVRTTLFSAEYLPKGEPLKGASLAESDKRATELLDRYKKWAAAEGAGTGAGGILLGMADFPLLLGIKMKFLFELAHAYGYSTNLLHERLFILNVFQLAYSSPEKKPALLDTIKEWPTHVAALPAQNAYEEHVDWQQLQQEYRDTLDFRKLLQLLPGVGAIVGAWANYGLLEELGKTGTNSYRLRRLHPAESQVK